MTSTARKKIDTRTLEMFDKEVDRPEHDQVLIRLFEDDEQIGRLIHELHGSPVRKPFDEGSTFKQFSRNGFFSRSIGIEEATKLTGNRPVWKSATPFHIQHKSLEVPLNYSTDDHGKYSRLIGFIDIGVSYTETVSPYIECDNKGGAHWKAETEQHVVLFEVKSAWLTAGNLIRQLNLYRCSSPLGFFGRRRHVLVGPDDSMNDIAHQHGYRLVTFNEDASKFTLCPAPKSKPKTEQAPGEF